MAKEMMIVFVYDTTRCQKEEDDPADAVMYFHPAWVSPTQRLALAGQLMGVYQFLSTIFSPPTLISLQGGKFVFKKFNQYVVAVGTDRNIQDWILERRANCLDSIIKFFHSDFETILASFHNDRNKFTEKLYQMFETYLPILQYSANLFASMPIIRFPSTASNVFLESMQVLQYCQEMSGVLGGAMFYSNKVVATQLSAELTKQLVITDPYRIRAPADRVSTDFHLPVGVQLLRVYIQRHTSLDVHDNPTKTQNNVVQMDLIPTKYKKSSLPISAMKRDNSRIFTVPEESEAESIVREFPRASLKRSSMLLNSTVALEKKQLELKSKYSTNLLTPSVCSTPLKDVNRVLHGNVLSICRANDDLEIPEKSKGTHKKENMNDIPDVVKEALRCKRLNKIETIVKEKLEKRSRREVWSRRSSSLTDLEEIKETVLNSAIIPFNSGELHKMTNKPFFNTITDPYYPVFRHDGFPVSKTLYDYYISSHYQELVKEYETNVSSRNPTNLDYTTNESNNVDGFDIVLDSEVRLQTQINSSETKLNSKCRQEKYRRSMSLPLKSLNAPANDDDQNNINISHDCGISFALPRRKLEGLQLTPLMSKLSLLAHEERTNGLCSKETTPSEYYGFSTSRVVNDEGEEEEKVVIVQEEEEEDEEDFWLNNKDCKDGNLEKAELFICGQHSMVLVLLMEDGTANNPELIHNFWETCMNSLGHLESRLQHCLEPLPSTEHKELYSVLSIDPQWDTLHRSGLWGVTELDIVSALHNRFTRASDLTDIIVRTEDTVVYGCQFGKTEVFYQQAMTSNTSGGLPTPADLMGIVPLKAKRRLERDHGIIIL